MADHPLRPAIDRRFGRPLPHQLPNLTRVPLNADYSFPPQGSYRITFRFQKLSDTSKTDPHALLTRAPLVYMASHIYSVRLACVKPAASVRSEPGSNSHVNQSASLLISSSSRPGIALNSKSLN